MNSAAVQSSDGLRGWRRQLMIGTIGALVAFLATGGISGRESWADRGQLLAICIVYAFICAFIAPWVRPAALKRMAAGGPGGWWVSQFAMLPIVCLVGGSLAMLVLVPSGLVSLRSAPNFIFPWAASGTALAVLLTIFLAVSVYEVLRRRIDAATLELRTQERDAAEARRAAAEARLAALESKVDPHFLFNALNSIVALIPADPRGAALMTERLATLMRSTLDASTPTHALGDEMRLVQTYLEIQQVRFDGRLRYALAVPESTVGMQVPRLAIQTLVENSVKYAVNARPDGALIEVTANLDGPTLRVTVSDNGPGFDSARLPPGHGLDLLQRRLAMTSADARLLIASDDRRTRVTVEVPTT